MMVRMLLMVMSIMMLAACQLFEQRRWEPEPEPEPATAEEPEQLDQLDQALVLLQDGDPEMAEELLTELLSERGDHGLARLLLRQIREAPESLLGETHREILVEPGDTLSELAARHAGNGMLFYSLARLNSIERPRLLQPGQLLKVPADTESAEDVPIEAALIDHESEVTPEIVPEAHDEPEAVPEAAVSESLSEARANEVEHYHDRALRAWREQDVEAAVADWERVLELDPGFRPAEVYLERAREVLRRLEAL
ncbi:LysM peptidoglycan-binding domain-containing protein [Wenzhouxiangella sp. AB-CW3]|uniref:LysM peptidoglycan-binding domain-containing protein n=1 Tax=Wenzhouxiangella sp. AB-CW3 TaxID=2771012 RepID=UPI00168A8655|nr:LysM peptidoglycan-binding domain-containing protein [Wenzhouxiangella sp. AB-CW3]QOC21153.1 LysM peptidoglycan-binding domain-containing protein [Wenzhouxiangella sp. AB-CW3]